MRRWWCTCRGEISGGLRGSCARRELRRTWRAARSRMRRRRAGGAGWRARLDGLDEMECGPAPVLLLVGRAMASLLNGVEDEVGRELVGEAVAELGLQE